MGLFDKLKEATGVDKLVDSAKEKVSDATGIDVDKAVDVADNLVDAGDSVSEAVEGFKAKSE